MSRAAAIAKPAWRIQVKRLDGSIARELNFVADSIKKTTWAKPTHDARKAFDELEFLAGEASAEYQIRHPGKSRFLAFAKRAASEPRLSARKSPPPTIVAARAAVECDDSPTGHHVFSPDEEYAQKKGLSGDDVPISCEHCGLLQEPAKFHARTETDIEAMRNKILAATTTWAREEGVSQRALRRLCLSLAKHNDYATLNLPDDVRAAFDGAAKELK